MATNLKLFLNLHFGVKKKKNSNMVKNFKISMENFILINFENNFFWEM
jgi:hypothetical protein